MLKLKTDRPLAVFDIEATGTSPRADRIVELAVVRLMPDGSRDSHVWRINPEMPIPPEATQIHGIFDADVAQCPTFGQLAAEILQVFDGCDMAGFNVNRYDIPMLTEEFMRQGTRFEIEGRRVLDAQTIFHRREPRDLTAALAFYCNELHVDAHGAEGDVLATIRVIEGQFERYADLPHDMDELDRYCNQRDPAWVDRMGRLKWSGNEIVLNFGKKKGMSLRTMVEEEKGFLNWILRSDFGFDVKEVVANALRGEWPDPPEAKPDTTAGESQCRSLND